MRVCVFVRMCVCICVDVCVKEEITNSEGRDLLEREKMLEGGSSL